MTNIAEQVPLHADRNRVAQIAGMIFAEVDDWTEEESVEAALEIWQRCHGVYEEKPEPAPEPPPVVPELREVTPVPLPLWFKILAPIGIGVAFLLLALAFGIHHYNATHPDLDNEIINPGSTAPETLDDAIIKGFGPQKFTCNLNAPAHPCDFQEWLWERDFRADRETIDSFRRCQTVTTQREDEPWIDFVNRVGKVKPYSCFIVRNKPQAMPTRVLQDLYSSHDVTVFGGTFDGKIKAEASKQRPTEN